MWPRMLKHVIIAALASSSTLVGAVHVVCATAEAASVGQVGRHA